MLTVHRGKVVVQPHGTMTWAGNEVPCWLRHITVEETGTVLGGEGQAPVCHPKELEDYTSLPGESWSFEQASTMGKGKKKK